MKYLIIQTAFIGDVILATSLIETIKKAEPDAQIDFLLRKGNESLLKGNPNIKNLFIWNKNENKISNLIKTTKEISKQKYDKLINCHRFASSGFISVFSGAKEIIGFTKNPLSFLFNKKVKHEIGNGKHEIERNFQLISYFINTEVENPKLYPSQSDFEKILEYKNDDYVCIAPASVWFTKQLPVDKWVELSDVMGESITIYLVGAPNDMGICDEIISKSKHKNIVNLAGKLSLLQTAALMKGAIMSYTNDSAPMHLASAMDANTVAVFCSTVPEFGFGPLSANSQIAQLSTSLGCRPCGLHGKSSCPELHFNCAYGIDIERFGVCIARPKL